MNRDILRGRIVSMYKSLLKFSKAINWSSRKTYDIINGRQEPTAKDIEDMCDVLQVEIPCDMRELFFTR